MKALRSAIAVSMACVTVAWSSGWMRSSIIWSNAVISVAPSSPKSAAQRLSQKPVSVRRSRSQIPMELASSATSRRTRDAPAADWAAESSSSATTEAASCCSSSAASSLQFRGTGS